MRRRSRRLLQPKTIDLFFETLSMGREIGDRLVRLPRSNKTKRADGLIVYPNRLVVYEIKSKHPRAAGRRGPRTIDEREQELVDIGVGDATEQIADTISELRGGNLDELLPAQYDWTTTRIVPSGLVKLSDGTRPSLAKCETDVPRKTSDDVAELAAPWT